MPSSNRVAIVTGANKGIGLAIVRQLALQYAQSPLATGPLLIYLTARDRGRGEAALQSLATDSSLRQAKTLVRDGGNVDVRFHALDVAQHASVAAFAKHVRDAHPEGVDVVINNAGVAMSGFDRDVVRQTLAINYYGTLAATEAFRPLLRTGTSTSRLVNVASMSGHLTRYPPPLRQKFLSAAASGSPSATTDLMQAFEGAVASGTQAAEGWPSAAYAVSKAGVIGMTRAMAREEQNKGDKALLNSCCPGYVRTDMTKGGGPKSVDEGAMTPVMLALADIGGVSGEFWQHERVIEW